MNSKFTKAVNSLNKIYMVGAVFFLIILSVCCVLQVISRSFLNGAITFTEEVARYAFIWMNMLGASLCVAKGTHASVELLNNALKGRLKQIHNIVITLAVVGIACLFAFQGAKMASVAFGQLSPTIRMDMGIMYCSVVCFGFGAAINGIHNILGYIDAYRKEGK